MNDLRAALADRYDIEREDGSGRSRQVNEQGRALLS
jgi:hypothetical protein